MTSTANRPTKVMGTMAPNPTAQRRKEHHDQHRKPAHTGHGHHVPKRNCSIAQDRLLWEDKNVSCMYLAQHELKSKLITTIVMHKSAASNQIKLNQMDSVTCVWNYIELNID